MSLKSDNIQKYIKKWGKELEQNLKKNMVKVMDLKSVAFKQGIPFTFIKNKIKRNKLAEYIEENYKKFIIRIYQGAVWLYKKEDPNTLIQVEKIPNNLKRDYQKIVKEYYIDPNEVIAEIIKKCNELIIKERISFKKAIVKIREEMRIAPFYNMAWAKSFLSNESKKILEEIEKEKKNNNNNKKTKIKENNSTEPTISKRRIGKNGKIYNTIQDNIIDQYKNIVDKILKFDTLAEVSRFLHTQKIPSDNFKLLYDYWIIKRKELKDMVDKPEIKNNTLFDNLK